MGDVFSPGAERDVFRRQAIAGLEDEATRRYLDELEGQRDAARSSLADAVERGRQLRSELESRRSSLLSVQSLTPGAAFPASASRSSSRPRTPVSSTTRTNSRPSSRSTTATQSRPPTATSHGPGTSRLPSQRGGLPRANA